MNNEKKKSKKRKGEKEKQEIHENKKRKIEKENLESINKKSQFNEQENKKRKREKEKQEEHENKKRKREKENLESINKKGVKESSTVSEVSRKELEPVSEITIMESNLAGSIEYFLKRIGFNPDEVTQYTQLLQAQKYNTVGDLLKYKPEEKDLKEYGIAAGKDRKQILTNLSETQTGIKSVLPPSEPCPPPSQFQQFVSPYAHRYRSFYDFRLNKVWFQDKTKFLTFFESINFDRFAIFRRPPRFGKSFWLQVLACYYDINQKSFFDFCFSNLEINQPPSKYYLILYIDFTTVQKGSFDSSSIGECVQQSLSNFVYNYAEILGSDYFNLLKDGDVEETWKRILQRVQRVNQKIFLLIDEIDAGASDVLKNFTDMGDISKHNVDTIKKLFGSVKNPQVGKVIDRGFATGITTLTVLDILSLGCWRDISDIPELNELCGLTKDNIISFLRQFSSNDLPDDAVLIYLEESQNGYRFNFNSTPLYNTTLTIRILEQYLQHENNFLMNDTTDIIPKAFLSLWKHNKTMIDCFSQLAQSAEPIKIDEPFQYIGSVDNLNTLACCHRLLFSLGFFNLRRKWNIQNTQSDFE